MALVGAKLPTSKRGLKALEYVVALVQAECLMPSEIVNVAQLANAGIDGLFDIGMAGWLPTHAHCFAVARFGRYHGIPGEIRDGAKACVEGMYDPNSEDGRMPAHRLPSPIGG